MHREVSGLNRGLAVALAWLCGGGVGAYVGFTQARWLLAVCGVLAIAYGVAWLRVARRGRLLSWREFVAPWRSG